MAERAERRMFAPGYGRRSAPELAPVDRRPTLRLVDRKPGQPSYVQTRKAESHFGAQLRKVARQIGDFVTAAAPSDPIQAAALADRLRKYAQILGPWAQSVAARMIADVSRADRQVWRARSAEMGRLLHHEIDNAPTGQVMRGLLAEQVSLITSLPVQAAARVHKLTIEAITNGARASEIAAEIMRTGEVTKSRATLIARTEVGRTASALNQARAQFVGSTAYVWRTAHDSDVRPSHAAMEGKVVDWAQPPTLDGLTGHAGALPNCRCYSEPIVPDLI